MAEERVGGQEGVVRFGQLGAEAWAARRLILIVTALFTVAGAVAGVVIPKQYRAEILLSQAESSEGGGGALESLGAQAGVLASLAGFSLSGKGAKEEAVAVLQSRLITEAYLRDNDLLPVLYPKKWNRATNSWKSADADEIPTLWKATRYFEKKVREVKIDKQSGLITMRITWRDPTAAAKWANDLVKNTNQYMREKAIKELDQNMAYLNTEVAKTNVVEVRSAIYSILKEELNKEMIARGREEYALKVIDPAQRPELPSSLSGTLLTGIGLVVGLLVSAILVWGRGLLP